MADASDSDASPPRRRNPSCAGSRARTRTRSPQRRTASGVRSAASGSQGAGGAARAAAGNSQGSASGDHWQNDPSGGKLVTRDWIKTRQKLQKIKKMPWQPAAPRNQQQLFLELEARDQGFSYARGHLKGTGIIEIMEQVAAEDDPHIGFCRPRQYQTAIVSTQSCFCFCHSHAFHTNVTSNASLRTT